MVKLSPLHPKVEGLSLATVGYMRREKKKAMTLQNADKHLVNEVLDEK